MLSLPAVGYVVGVVVALAIGDKDGILVGNDDCTDGLFVVDSVISVLFACLI